MAPPSPVIDKVPNNTPGRRLPASPTKRTMPDQQKSVLANVSNLNIAQDAGVNLVEAMKIPEFRMMRESQRQQRDRFLLWTEQHKEGLLRVTEQRKEDITQKYEREEEELSEQVGRHNPDHTAPETCQGINEN